MTTGLDTIVTAFVERCTLVAQATAGVFEDRQAAFTKADAPAINITLRNAQYQQLGDTSPALGTLSAVLEVDIAVYTRGEIDASGNTTPARLLGSPIWQAVHRALMQDPSLGGIAARLRLRRSAWQSQDADGAAGWAAHTYGVVFVMRESDLTLFTHPF